MRKSGIRVDLFLFGFFLFGLGFLVAMTPVYNHFSHEIAAESAVESFYREYHSDLLAEDDGNEPSHKADDGENREKPMVYPELFAAMQAYNEDIYENKQEGLSDPWCYSATAINLRDYGVEGETVGVLKIPKMDFEEPVYLGATEDHLDRGAAQLSISSMPIGGVNTNCVLAGHRGWIGADHMRYIEKLEVGDPVLLVNLWSELMYEVVEIRVIEPYQPEELLIQEGRDLLTIVTCHPYGSGGKHRYVVACERR